MSSRGATSTRFNIAASVKAFSVLSSNLYTDRVKAIIRELSTNAVDAHVAAGNAGKRFDVYLPTTWSKQFTIRDYGTGLSREAIEHLYTTYFESDKNHTDELIGGLGLGSKSPFCYTDNFTVTSYHNGEKHIYSMCIENGYPTCKFLISEETKEPNGLEITIGTLNDDYEWRSKAEEVYRYFDHVLPNIKGGSCNISKQVYSKKTSKWGIVAGANQYDNMMVVMGGVAYKVNLDAIPEHKVPIKIGGLHIFSKIGEVEIAASRESLHMDERTIKCINDAIEDYLSDTIQMLQKELDSCKSVWYVKLALEKYINQNRIFHETVLSFLFKKQRLICPFDKQPLTKAPQISLKELTDNDMNFDFEVYNLKGSNKISKTQALHVLSPTNVEAAKVVINDTGKSNIKSRIAGWLNHRGAYNCFYLNFFDVYETVPAGSATNIKPKRLFTADEVKKAFFECVGWDDNMPFLQKASTIPVYQTAGKKTSGPSPVVEFRPRCDGNGVGERAYWRNDKIDISKEKTFFYVPVVHDRGIVDEAKGTSAGGEYIKYMLRLYQYMTGKEPTVYGLRKMSLKSLRDSYPHMTNFFEEFLKVFDAKVKDNLLEKLANYVALYDANVVVDKKVLAQIKKDVDAGPSLFHEHLEMLETIEDFEKGLSAAGCVQIALAAFEKKKPEREKFDKLKKDRSVADDIKKLEGKYPLMRHLGYRRVMSEAPLAKDFVDYINMVNNK